jgi:hypothetical protein
VNAESAESAGRKGVTVGPANSWSVFPSATAFERHGDGSLSVYEGELVIAVFEPGFGGAFMSDSLAGGRPAQ